MKIAYISNHPAPYRDPLMARLGTSMPGDIEFFNELPLDKGHSFWDLKKHGYEASDLYPKGAGCVGRIWHLMHKFILGKYDFVLWTCFMSKEMTAAIFLSAIFGRKYGFAADTVKQLPLNCVRKFIKTLIVRRAELIFVPGEAGVRFWSEQYGVPYEKLIKGAYALDNEKIRSKVETFRKDRTAIRAEYGIASDDIVFLMVANMIPTRHYPITTEAFVRFANGRRGFKFVIVGKGPDYAKMVSYSKDHPEIIPIDGVSFDTMLSLYAMADVYIHGGTEPASTALVIGAVAGLPLISSRAVGCSADVLRDGESGIEVSDYLSVEDWRMAFERMVALKASWIRMGIVGFDLAKLLDVTSAQKAFEIRLNSLGLCHNANQTGNAIRG